MTSEGIYRKSGVNSRVAALDDRFHRDARSLCLREGEHQVDDVSNTLKRFFRELKDGGLFTQDKSFWLNAAGQQRPSLAVRLSLFLSASPLFLLPGPNRCIESFWPGPGYHQSAPHCPHVVKF